MLTLNTQIYYRNSVFQSKPKMPQLLSEIKLNLNVRGN